MTEKEILAEYKIAYRQFEDILDNADNEQITESERLKIVNAMNILEELYRELYQRIKSAEDISLYYEEDIIIGEEIYIDYVLTEDNTAITYKDMENESKWWEDYDFLTEF